MRPDFDLIIDMREGGDWSLDLLFAGLVQNLGPGGVVDFPFRQKHRSWDPANRTWNLERGTLGWTPLNGQVNCGGKWDETYLRGAAGCGLVRRVWLDERMESFQMWRSIPELQRTRVPVVVVAGHDRFWNHSPEFVRSLYGDCFQAMLLDNWEPRFASLPFPARRIGWSCNFDHYWRRPEVPPEKTIDICFVGYNSHPDRARFIDHVIRRWGHLNNHIFLETRPDTIGEFVPKDRLFDTMLRSKVCLNLRGAAVGGKALRAYEIAHVGSFMLSQRIEDSGMQEDFPALSAAAYFSDEEELDDCIAYYCASDCAAGNHDREDIARTGYTLASGPLSVRERWADVIRWLDGGCLP